jgi:gas vesicle protein
MLNNHNTISFIAGSLVGAFTGAGLALLLAPQSGAKTRAQIRDKGIALKEQTTGSLVDAGRRTQNQINNWQEKGQQAVKKGRSNVAQSVQRGKEALEEKVSRVSKKEPA